MQKISKRRDGSLPETSFQEPSLRKTILRHRRFIQIAVLGAIYFVAARLGLMLGAVSGFATFVWPPTGISLAAILVFGFDLWPGIALGAFFANWSLGAPVGVAMGISVGNTLEALTGAFFLRRLGFLTSLESLGSVMGLVLPAALLSPLISATMGVGSLFLGGKLSQSDLGATWFAWWLGDAMGDLVVAPFLLVWSAWPFFKKGPRQILEAVFLGLMALLSSLVIFTDWIVSGTPLFARPFFIFPVMMVLAVRLGQRAVVTTNLVLAIIVIYTTALGSGRFWTGSLPGSLLEAQVFLAVLIVSKLVLAAAMAERKRLYIEARNAIRAREEFMSIASHELKTPLTSLKLQLQMAQRGVKPDQNIAPLPAMLAKALSVSNAQVDRLIALVEDLLDVSKIGAGRLSLRFEKLDFCDLVKDAVERLAVVASEARCPVEVNARSDVMGFWDRSRIEQAVANLLHNAIKYAPGQPIIITVSSDDHGAILIVEDFGPGIPKEQQSKIFDRFERATTSKSISGLGLGLFIVDQIVRAHRGSIHVESEAGQGAKFVVKLPLNLENLETAF